MNDTPLIRLTGLYENTSARTGRTYYVGVLGGAKLLLLEDTKAEPGHPGWALYVTERPQKGQQQPRQPGAGRPGRAPATTAWTGKRATTCRSSGRPRGSAAAAARPIAEELDHRAGGDTTGRRLRPVKHLSTVAPELSP